MIKYGLISETDARTLEKTIDLVCRSEFIGQDINVCEVGVYDGQTSRGIYEYVRSRGYGASSTNSLMNFRNYNCNYTGIDNEKDKPILKPFPECKLIIGNSTEVYNQIEDNSQHLIFIDGDHSLIGVISDFFAYSRKVKNCGYFAFHDTGRHIKSFKDFQHGDKENPDAYISVRKALTKIGMFHDAGYDMEAIKKGVRYVGNHGFRIVFDEADETDDAGGIIVFKKGNQIHELYESYFGSC